MLIPPPERRLAAANLVYNTFQILVCQEKMKEILIRYVGVTIMCNTYNENPI